MHRKDQGYRPSIYNYVEVLLSKMGVPIHPTYAQGFFTVERFKTIYSADSWATTPASQRLVSLSVTTFNVYSMLQCLPAFHSHPQLIPARGIEVLQAKSIATMVHLLFAMIDMKPDFATSPFDSSILGTRISLWSQLPGLIPINSLWNAHPASVTFYWFNSLRELLHIFHCWIKAQRYHQTQGFTTASDSQGAMHIQLVDTLPQDSKSKATIDVFRSLSKILRPGTDEIDTFLSKESAVYDWTRLGIFTGSRVAEYAQTRLAKGVSPITSFLLRTMQVAGRVNHWHLSGMISLSTTRLIL